MGVTTFKQTHLPTASTANLVPLFNPPFAPLGFGQSAGPCHAAPMFSLAAKPRLSHLPTPTFQFQPLPAPPIAHHPAVQPTSSRRTLFKRRLRPLFPATCHAGHFAALPGAQLRLPSRPTQTRISPASRHTANPWQFVTTLSSRFGPPNPALNSDATATSYRPATIIQISRPHPRPGRR